MFAVCGTKGKSIFTGNVKCVFLRAHIRREMKQSRDRVVDDDDDGLYLCVQTITELNPEHRKRRKREEDNKVKTTRIE